MLKPSGGLFKKLFNPERMKSRMKSAGPARGIMGRMRAIRRTPSRTPPQASSQSSPETSSQPAPRSGGPRKRTPFGIDAGGAMMSRGRY